ncbi:MAG: tyrosine-type recombinase/integrase, partial [Candidatus Hydrothermarchaeaceae archaeon]
MGRKKYLPEYIEMRLGLIKPPRDEAAREFMDYIKATRPNVRTQAPYADGLAKLEELGDWGDRDYRDLSKKDLMSWNQRLEEKHKAAYQYRRAVKSFYQWLYFGEEPEKGVYPDQVRWMKTSRSRNNGDDKPKFLSQEQIKKLISTARNQRDRALFAVGYDSGARPGELINMRVDDVTMDKHGAKVRLSGKTGTRHVRIVNSVPDLQLWLNQHPSSEEDAPLRTAALGDAEKPLTKGGYDSIFYRACARAELP